jgi:GAF domain-containing protein
MVVDLPDVTGNPSPSDEKLYAAKTYTTVETVRKRRPSARCYCGIPIEIQGKMWGVLVFTSRDGKALKSENLKAFELVAPLLGKLLQEV